MKFVIASALMLLAPAFALAQATAQPAAKSDTKAAAKPAAAAAPGESAPSAHAPQSGPVSDLRAAVDAYEKQILSDTMARCRFNQKVAAEALGLSYDQIRHALKKHGLNQ